MGWREKTGGLGIGRLGLVVGIVRKRPKSDFLCLKGVVG